MMSYDTELKKINIEKDLRHIRKAFPFQTFVSKKSTTKTERKNVRILLFQDMLTNTNEMLHT